LSTLVLAPAAAADAIAAAPAAPLKTDPAPLRWLDGVPDNFQGTTWGLPWARGEVARDSGFALRADGADQFLQSWPLAYWPDGSLKWSGHALPPSPRAPAPGYQVVPVSGRKATDAALARQDGDAIVIDTGILQCRLTPGALLFDELRRAGKALARQGRLVLLVEEGDGDAGDEGAKRAPYQGRVDTLALEQNGPSRAVVRVAGSHRRDGDATQSLLPFVVRLVFYKNADSVRLVHNITIDADPAKHTIRAIGLRLEVPLAAPLYERHLRLTSADGGVFAESVRTLTGLRRDPGAAVQAAQFEGRASAPEDQWGPGVAPRLNYVPAFGSYSLLQSQADGFTIHKRTKAGYAWIKAAAGARASGSGYLGTPQGGVAFGIRHFWQSYPGQIDIAGADSDAATLTLWLWAPRGPAMELRPYHDGLGEDTFEKQREALEITYEDYEPGFNASYGVARTSELELQLLPATPSATGLAAIARRIEAPPQLVATPERLRAGSAFSELWAPASGIPPGRAGVHLAGQLAWLFDFYRDQVEQRKWYGYWDFGDVMHTYDATRHVWRYDVGGFAWDNSELSTEIWLWHYYLHSGRPDAFRMAEAMTRHTSEVDVHHIGPFSPLGSRHDVQHWGDSAKQLRVSTAVNRRFMYYLTADERLGELLREQVNAVERLRQVLPGRKIGQRFPEDDPEHHASVSFGTDWGAVAAAWFTEWERSGDPRYRDRLAASMASIAAQPHGFFTGIGVMDLRTGAFAIDRSGVLSVSHLSSVFGLAEICSELNRSLDIPAFRDAWRQYGILYSASPEQQKAALGQELLKLNLGQGHARLLAYAGAQQNDPALRRAAWQRFLQGRAGLVAADFKSQKIAPPLVLNPVDEAPRISTNAAALWGLGALALLALAPAELPEDA
jgi:hypothetical protein